MYNPFATSKSSTEEDTPEYATPQSQNFAVPGVNEGAPYNDEFGWSARLRTSPTEIPSAQRLGTIPRYDFVDDPTKPPFDPRSTDVSQRHGVERVRPNGWSETKGVSAGAHRWEDNPRRNAPPEPRVTNSLAPRGYSFQRPFDTGYARQFNGVHFSMADHRRDYPILGMEPVKTRRNTFRAEPTPWDVNIVDVPAPEPVVNGRYETNSIPPSTRTWRLV